MCWEYSRRKLLSLVSIQVHPDHIYVLCPLCWYYLSHSFQLRSTTPRAAFSKPLRFNTKEWHHLTNHRLQNISLWKIANRILLHHHHRRRSPEVPPTTVEYLNQFILLLMYRNKLPTIITMRSGSSDRTAKTTKMHISFHLIMRRLPELKPSSIASSVRSSTARKSPSQSQLYFR